MLLVGGATFAAIPFGYIVGGQLVLSGTTAPLPNALFLLGPLLIPAGYSLILPGVALVFPDGHLPTRRLRPLLVIAMGLLAIGMLMTLITPGEIAATPGSRNPFGVDWFPLDFAGLYEALYGIGVLAITVLSVAGVVLRYRGGSSLVRAQLRWFLAAVLLAAGPLAVSVQPSIGGLQWALVSMVGLLLVPVSVGIAIRRHGLYEIDRIISRTLAYAVLTASLAVVYVAGFLSLQALAAPLTGDVGPIPVAASTIAVAALFQPLRRRIQHAVDRRFHRARYDAEATATAFARTVRDEVDPTAVEAALLSAVESVVRPQVVTGWLREMQR